MARGLYNIMTKTNILFVDDEEHVLNSIRRLLARRCKNWHIVQTTDPFEALEILNRQTIDVIVSDIIMPKMQGDELLDKIAHKYPHIIRVVLSAHAESDAVTKALSISHQYISKPFETKSFIQNIQDIIELRNELNHYDLIKKINNIDALPPMPKVYREIMSILNNPEANIHDIAKLISHDLSLSSKILQVINSAYFAMPKQVLNIEDAVTYLGIDIVKSLCITSNLFNSYNDLQKAGLSHRELLNKAIRIGRVAKHIAMKISSDDQIANHAQLAGFLHNLGMVILGSVITDEYLEIINIHKKTQHNLLSLEKEKLGICHNMIGAYLLQLWAVPLEIIHAQIYLYQPLTFLEKATKAEFNALTAIHIAKAVDDMLDNSSIYYKENYSEAYLKALNIETDLNKYIKICKPLYAEKQV